MTRVDSGGGRGLYRLPVLVEKLVVNKTQGLHLELIGSKSL